MPLTQTIKRTNRKGDALSDTWLEVTLPVPAERLDRAGLRAGGTGTGRHRFYVSDSTEDFAALASVFLREDVGSEVEQIDITEYEGAARPAGAGQG